jgi:hypothetical protein
MPTISRPDRNPNRIFHVPMRRNSKWSKAYDPAVDLRQSIIEKINHGAVAQSFDTRSNISGERFDEKDSNIVLDHCSGL